MRREERRGDERRGEERERRGEEWARSGRGEGEERRDDESVVMVVVLFMVVVIVMVVYSADLSGRPLSGKNIEAGIHPTKLLLYLSVHLLFVPLS